jgi:hypothetical protein
MVDLEISTITGQMLKDRVSVHFDLNDTLIFPRDPKDRKPLAAPITNTNLKWIYKLAEGKELKAITLEDVQRMPEPHDRWSYLAFFDRELRLSIRAHQVIGDNIIKPEQEDELDDLTELGIPVSINTATPRKKAPYLFSFLLSKKIYPHLNPEAPVYMAPNSWERHLKDLPAGVELDPVAHKIAEEIQSAERMQQKNGLHIMVENDEYLCRLYEATSETLCICCASPEELKNQPKRDLPSDLVGRSKGTILFIPDWRERINQITGSLKLN